MNAEEYDAEDRFKRFILLHVISMETAASAAVMVRRHWAV